VRGVRKLVEPTWIHVGS
jgi:exonuclease III